MSGRTARALAILIVALTIGACSGTPLASGAGAASASDTEASPSAPGRSAATSPAAGTPEPSVAYDGLIDVGGDRTLEARCLGTGSPTVLLEGGGTAPTIQSFPFAFVKRLAETTTVCQYSHAGAGLSAPLPSAGRTIGAVVDDAYAMLTALKKEANVEGPYIFVGHSFGGTVALAEALAHPEQTAGLVILDTDFVTEFLHNCVKSGRTEADCQQEYDDDIEAKSMEKDLLPLIHPLPDIPMRIVSAMEFPDCDPSNPESLKANLGGRMIEAADCDALAEAFATAQHDGWSTVQPELEQLRVDADHDGIVSSGADEVEALVRDLVLQVRGQP